MKDQKKTQIKVRIANLQSAKHKNKVMTNKTVKKN